MPSSHQRSISLGPLFLISKSPPNEMYATWMAHIIRTQNKQCLKNQDYACPPPHRFLIAHDYFLAQFRLGRVARSHAMVGHLLLATLQLPIAALTAGGRKMNEKSTLVQCCNNTSRFVKPGFGSQMIPQILVCLNICWVHLLCSGQASL